MEVRRGQVLDHLQSAARGALARRQADHRRRRRLHLQHADGEGQPVSTATITATSPRPRSSASLRVKFQFKHGDNRELPVIMGQLADPAEALVGDPQLRERAAGAAAGQRPLQARQVRHGPLLHHGARAGLLGQGSADQYRHRQLRSRSATTTSRTRKSSWRPSRPAPSTSARRELRQALGDRLRLSRGQGRPGHQGEDPAREPGRHPGFHLQPAQADVRRTARCARR